jgi:signal transduction histidine kinase
MLEQDLGQLNQNQQHCLNVIKDDTKRLNRLLKDMLDLSRFDEGVQFIDRRKQVSLGFLVAKVIETFRIFAKSKNISLNNCVPKSLPTFKGDRDRLQQVLSNLVENSIKYTLTGGSVEIGAELHGSILKCWVRDNGVGIPEDRYDLIFQRFRQLDNFPDQGHRGYGLGLSIARQIVENNGGKLWVESKVGIGSVFYFTITV